MKCFAAFILVLVSFSAGAAEKKVADRKPAGIDFTTVTDADIACIVTAVNYSNRLACNGRLVGSHPLGDYDVEGLSKILQSMVAKGFSVEPGCSQKFCLLLRTSKQQAER